MIVLLLGWVFSCDFCYLASGLAFFFAFCFYAIYRVIAFLYNFYAFPLLRGAFSFLLLSMPDMAFSFVSFGQCVTQCFSIFKQVSRGSSDFSYLHHYVGFFIIGNHQRLRTWAPALPDLLASQVSPGRPSTATGTRGSQPSW